MIRFPPQLSLLPMVCVLLLPLLGSSQVAQSPGVNVAEGFEVNDYYPPENTKLRWRVTGGQAQPQSSGQYLLTTLKIESFRENGERGIVIEAPECIYDSVQGHASSKGRLQVQSADGRFSVSGEGFLWQQELGVVTISNQIRSVVQRAETNAAAAPLVITSRWFTFDTTNRSAIFHEDVRGDDPEMEFTCGQLLIHAAAGEQASEGKGFEIIEAEQSLVLIGKNDGRRCTADRGIYVRSTERIELIGNVNWQEGLQSGRADRAVVYRGGKNIGADGRVVLRLPRESLGSGGALFGMTNAADKVEGAVPLVDVYAEHFQSWSNWTVAEGSVRLVDGGNKLTCEKLSVRSATPAQPDTVAIAEQNVVLENGDGILRAPRAVYTKSNSVIIFTGEPTWTRAQIEGHAHQLTVHTGTGEIRAEEHVSVKVTLDPQRTSFLTLFPAAIATNNEPQKVVIFSDEFIAAERRGVFHGNVHAHQVPVTGSESRLRSDELVVHFAPTTNRIESLLAQKNVVYEQGTPGETNGPATYRKLTTRKLTASSDPDSGALSRLVAEGDVQIEQPPEGVARGGRATYTVATDFLELTENPSLDTPQAIITNANSLFWDKAKRRYTGTGPFKIKFKPEAVRQVSKKLKSP